ncbi:DNA replication licensing factor, putative [Eimeria tenella]|uniref:DNA replication licensing factor, putative n=1 Tax=Eimeria tenella TaxID=5802 RepID=U6KNW3_EIMTE|nr:DNA replication licensing factor, putative [Eimeria tenella]CDJ39666.1 DNA replication licensing factor, putative [Eimeria tenella]|eukprot:XP_013230421.1 DNA replication licensing factor, putative [Eimeria tenella]
MLQSVPGDLLNIKAFASRPDLLQVLGHSFAPAVCGHDVVKQGLLLQLAGGRLLQQQQHRVRGDIHVLLVGDPAAGKSQLLRFALRLLPGAVSSTGRGSSGVGLTAAVAAADAAEPAAAAAAAKRVEAGAMVLADKSLICIDEFDKMQIQDRVAIHEVMEQQTVTVAKAGIYTTLNARCSVLAAANPLYGCWSEGISFRQQIAFEDSLMSRFDLIFIVRDATTSEEDDRLAEAGLGEATGVASGDRRGHTDSFIQPQTDMLKATHAAAAAAAADSQQQQQQEEPEPTRAFYHRTEMLYYDKKGREHECLTHEFLRMYIALEDVRVAQQMLLYSLFGEPYPEDGKETETETATETESEPRRGKGAITEDEEMAEEMEGLAITETKKRRTRRAAAAAAAAAGDAETAEDGRREALQALDAQGLSSDILHSLIMNSIKELDEGGGVAEELLLQAVTTRALARGLSEPTQQQFKKALIELNSKDSAPILVHDGLVYEC